MNHSIKIAALVIIINVIFSLIPDRISAQQNGVNFQLFYDQLSPYGQWIENDDYEYVWIPDAEPGFSPYLTNGYWMLTDYGWMWISDYDWGWAAFHYGRWDFNNSFGWFWIPDNDWGPSWVTWRRAEGYYGWAPMRPGISITIIFGGYNDVPDDRWVFVRDRDIERHDIGRNYIDRQRNFRIIRSSTVITRSYFDNDRRTTFVTGPGREDVQRITGRTIKPVAVRERNVPGYNVHNGQLQIYQPRIEKGYSIRKPAPLKFTKMNDINRIQKRNFQRENQIIDSKNNKEEQRGQHSLADRLDNKNREKIKRMKYPPQKENIENPPSNQRKIEPVKKDAKINRILQRQKIDVPRENKNKDKTQKVRVIDPKKKTNIEKPVKSNENKKKKEKRNDLLVQEFTHMSLDANYSVC